MFVRVHPWPQWLRREGHGADRWRVGRAVGLFRPDLLIEEKVVVELKAARNLETAHQAQLLNCLKATQIEIGLL
ncbi:MAG: GxxExxY protein, partial [Gemmatimonadota bacterium]